jgi:hypothetical protein
MGKADHVALMRIMECEIYKKCWSDIFTRRNHLGNVNERIILI